MNIRKTDRENVNCPSMSSGISGNVESSGSLPFVGGALAFNWRCWSNSLAGTFCVKD